jgi:hypothetical protein
MRDQTSLFGMAALLLTVTLAMNPLRGQPLNVPEQAVSPREALALVTKALEVAGSTKLAGLGIESATNPLFPDFYFFDVNWNNPNGSVVVGHYAIDRKTGDVWSSVVCREFTSPALKRLQEAVRRRIGIDKGAYRKLKRPGPMCPNQGEKVPGRK